MFSIPIFYTVDSFPFISSGVDLFLHFVVSEWNVISFMEQFQSVKYSILLALIVARNIHKF